MKFDNTQKELLKYFSNHHIFRLFLPFSSILLIICQSLLIVLLFNLRLNILESLVSLLTDIAIITTLAKGEYKILTIGSALRAIYYLLIFVLSLMDEYVLDNYGILIFMVVWIYFTYMSYTKVRNG